MQSDVRPEDYDVEPVAIAGESVITDDEQGRSPFDSTKVEYINTDNDKVDMTDPIPVILPPKPRLKTVVISAVVPPLTPILLLSENRDKCRTLIQVLTASETVYVGEQPSNATVNGGFQINSTMAPVEVLGSNALYATASAAAEVRCLIEYEVK